VVLEWVCKAFYSYVPAYLHLLPLENLHMVGRVLRISQVYLGGHEHEKRDIEIYEANIGEEKLVLLFSSFSVRYTRNTCRIIIRTIILADHR
jgi:hypothetical protein